MNWHSFLFSEKRSYEVRRHLAFWLIWWIYFTASYYHYEQTGLQKVEFGPMNFPFFIKSAVLLSIHIAACYYFINYVMPRYLFKGRYSSFSFQCIVLGILILFAGYFIHNNFFPLINTVFNYEPVIAHQNTWWTSISS